MAKGRPCPVREVPTKRPGFRHASSGVVEAGWQHRHDRRRAARHRFEHRQAERLRTARGDDCSRAGENCGHPGAIFEMTNEHHGQAHRQRLELAAQRSVANHVASRRRRDRQVRALPRSPKLVASRATGDRRTPAASARARARACGRRVRAEDGTCRGRRRAGRGTADRTARRTVRHRSPTRTPRRRSRRRSSLPWPR